VGPRSEKILSGAFDKVTARHRAARASGVPVSAGQLVLEVIAEACAEAGRIEARNLRKARKAYRRALEAARLVEALAQSPVFGDVVLELWFAGSGAAGSGAMTGEQIQADPRGVREAPVPGPPSWHPEHPDHESN
jgi:hypothetical protein